MSYITTVYYRFSSTAIVTKLSYSDVHLVRHSEAPLSVTNCGGKNIRQVDRQERWSKCLPLLSRGQNPTLNI